MQDVTGVLLSGLIFLIEIICVIVFLPVVIYFLIKIFKKITFQQEMSKKAQVHDEVFLKIKIPPSNEQKEEAMDAFLKSLHRLLGTGSNISLEMVSADQFLTFYIVVPKHYKNVVESQLYAQFPDAELEVAQDYFSKSDNAAIMELNFKTSSTNPLNIYSNLQEDLLKNLSAVLSKTGMDEKVYVQLVLKRTGSKMWERGLPGFFYKLNSKKGTESAAESKMGGDIYLGKMRIVCVAHELSIAKRNILTIANIFKMVKGPSNEFKKGSTNKSLIDAYAARIFENGDLWSIPEISTVYHFPYKGSVVSNVVNTTSKKAPAPDILLREGNISPKEISIFGETNYRNEGKRFGIKRIDRRRHMYVVGKTGSGKSRLLELLLISDIQNGEGCCILDPHGDLAQELLKHIPQHRIKDVVYVNPADRDFPIAFNPLEPVKDPEMRQHLATFFIAIFKKQFEANWNSRMEHIIRYITLALLETPDSNILGIPRILSDTTFRQRVIKQIQDPVVKSFWINEFSSWNERYSNDAIIPILNKVGQFVSNPIIRNMVGQRKNALPFDEFMDQGKIVLLNISKGKLGDENAAFLGSMFITKIQQAALGRAKVSEEQRRDFYFYVDEFQNFATDAFSSILSEARKYHLDLTIAHQYIAQLPDDVKATAFGNVGTIISFAIGGDDAAYLSHEFAPTFSAEDMINLNTREMYIKMSIDGKITPPFSAKTIDVPKAGTDYSREIIDKSRVKYGSNKTAVENEIKNWSSATETLSSNEDTDFPEPII